jgi:uncharacterized protein YggE
MRRTLVALCLMLGLAAIPAVAQQNMPTSPSISTEGRASIKVSPDIAWITVTAESRAPKTADAQKQNAAAVESLSGSLKRAGVPDDAVKTRSYSVEPQMQYTDGTSKIIGYIARQSLEVRIDDLTKIGAWIDAAGGSGATSVSDIRYDVKDRAGIEKRLLSEAVKDGMQRVTAMAVGAGVELRQIWRIDEQRLSNSPQPMYRMAAGRGGGAPVETQVSPAELEIQAHVTLTVLLK